MPTAPGIFVTGTARSGTSLVDKLLSMHPDAEVLSQPLPRLYPALKSLFLCRSGRPDTLDDAFPLNDLFAARYRPVVAFTDFLAGFRADPGWLAGVLQRMAQFPGRLVAPSDPPETLVPPEPVGTAAFVAHYLQRTARNPQAALLGSKEIVAEEFVPYLLASGTRVLLVLRDPRGVAASVYCGRGAHYAGKGLPLLFVLRLWRKSVAFALAHADDPALLVLRYEDLVADPEKQMQDVAAWLGLPPFPRGQFKAGPRDGAGHPWPSNSSHRPSHGISANSVNRWRDALPVATVAAIETLCAPELRRLGYTCTAGPGVAALAGLAADPCSDPRPVLAPYRWSATALELEAERLQALLDGRFEAPLHLFPEAFRALEDRMEP